MPLSSLFFDSNRQTHPHIMRTHQLHLLAIATLGLGLTAALFAQTSGSTTPAASAPKGPQSPRLTFPSASPTCTFKERIGLTEFEVAYSRPSVKGRKIF